MVRVFLGPFQFQILENVRSYVNDKLQVAYYFVTLVVDFDWILDGGILPLAGDAT